MKVLLFFLSFFLLQTNQYALAQSQHFAQITQSGVYLYKNIQGERLCELSSSYFVELIGESENYYRVKNDSVIGYVKKDEVLCVKDTPVNIHPLNTLTVFTTDGCVIRKTPYKSANTVGRLTLLKSYAFIGKIEGDELIPGRGKTWFYICQDINNEIITGYIYGGYCDPIIYSTQNNEKVTYIKNISFSQLTTSNEQAIKKNTLFVFIPVGIILILFILPTLISKKQRATHTKYISIKSSYDDNDL